MKRSAWLLLLLTLAVGLVFLGCSSNDDDGDDNPVGPGPVDGVGSITGLVQSSGRAPLDGVTVSAGGVSSQTNQDGYFVLAQVPEGERIVDVELDGWMASFRVVTVREGRTTHIPDLMLAPAETAVLSGAAGGTAATGDGTGTADFDAASFATGAGQAYTGQVTVEMTAATPDDSEFYGVFPGTFEGVREDGTTVMFESFGFMTVNLYGEDKAPLQLADGMTAALSLDIGADKAAVAPATIPMWYFDESDGQWHEEGEATLVGTAYETEVAHFTTWNWDLPVDQICTVTGTVVDAQQNPVVGARVLSSGVDYAIRDEAVTNSAGVFSVRARVDGLTDVYAMSGSRISGTVRVSVGTDCPVNIDTPLVLTVPAFSLSLTWGASPSDLDSHLWIPSPWLVDYDYYHLYYSTDGTLTEPPYAELDYDDTSSYGPENITGVRLYEGHYEYWIDSYSTGYTDDIWGSGAQVRLEIDGGTWIFDAADVAQPAADVQGWWHVVDFDVNAAGAVTVTPVQAFAEWPDLDVNDRKVRLTM